MSAQTVESRSVTPSPALWLLTACEGKVGWRTESPGGQEMKIMLGYHEILHLLPYSSPLGHDWMMSGIDDMHNKMKNTAVGASVGGLGSLAIEDSNHCHVI